MTPATITLDQVLAKLPAALQPWAKEYAPAFLTMTVSEFQAWFDLILLGDVYTAVRQVLAKLPNKTAFIARLDEDTTAAAAINAGNADSIALQKKAFTVLGGVLLSIGLAVFGF
jgi:hypothetical protein